MSKARELAELGAAYDSGALSNRNVIINGAMQCWQRATAATTTANGYSTVDRWKHFESGAGAYTTEQSTDHPTGTGYSLKFQVTTADTSIAAGEYAFTETNLEGQNLQQLQYGTSTAKDVTVSFWVKSNKTGIYCVALYKHAGAGTAYMYRKEYTISAANTWEKKVVTISPTAGSTALITASAGAVPNSNAMGLSLVFGLAWGSNYHGTDNTWQTGSGYGTSNQVNWMDSTSNNFYLAEVQLEAGTEATPFEHRSFGDELQACQRYFSKSYRYDKYAGDASSLGWVQTEFHENNQGAGYREYYAFPFAVRMRATPTITIYDTAGNAGKCNYYISAGSGNPNKVLTVSSANERTFGGYSDRATSIGGWACHYLADAEL